MNAFLPIKLPSLFIWTRAMHAVPHSAAAAFFQNSMLKKGHNYVKNLRVTCSTGMGSPFDSKQLV